MPLRINSEIILNEDEISFEFAKSSGPGGQNVNKVETAVKLKFDIKNSKIPDELKTLLFAKNDRKINSDGILTIEARESRSQLQNRQIAVKKLIDYLIENTKIPKKRTKTKPSFASQQNRIESKKKRGELKKMRGRIL